MKNIRHDTPYIFCFFLVVLLTVSCAVRERPSPTQRTEFPWVTKTPAQILNDLRGRKQKITDLTAAFSLSVDPPVTGQPSSINGVIFFAKRSEGPCVRIKGLGFFGRILFDLVQKGDTLRIYVPSRHTLYLGRTDSGKRAGNVWGDLFRTMFADFSNETVSGASTLSFKDDMVILPLVDGEIRLGRNSGLVRQWRHQNKITTYDHYNQEPGMPPVPTRIAVNTKDGSRHAVCRLSQVTINSNLRNVFDLSGYKPEFIRPLDELRGMSGP